MDELKKKQQEEKDVDYEDYKNRIKESQKKIRELEREIVEFLRENSNENRIYSQKELEEIFAGSDLGMKISVAVALMRMPDTKGIEYNRAGSENYYYYSQ